MNKYQEALNRIKTIDLDIIEDLRTRYEQSYYGIHDYPTLEMSGDIKTLQELVDKETPKKVKIKEFDNGEYGAYCPSCNSGLPFHWKMKYCPSCGQKLDWSEENYENRC